MFLTLMDSDRKSKRSYPSLQYFDWQVYQGNWWIKSQQHFSFVYCHILCMFQGGTGRTTGAVLSLAFDSNGTILWTGDEKVWYGIWL